MRRLRSAILVKNMESRPVVKLKFTTDFLEAVVRTGADELTLRAHEEGALRSFIDTHEGGTQGWGPPPVDENWHATCQAIYNCVEEAHFHVRSTSDIWCLT